MYLNIGQNEVVYAADLIGIFDLDKTTVVKSAREFLNTAEKKGRLSTVGSDLPRSFLLCAVKNKPPRVILSPVTAATLQNRLSGTEKKK